MNGDIEINMNEFFRMLLKRVWVIVLCAAICSTAVLVYTKNFVRPTYRASITVYVNNNSGRENPYISSSDLAVALRLVSTYVNIIQSNMVLEKVIDEAEVQISVPQLRNMITAKAIDETEMFEVAVTSTDPELSAKLVNTIAKVAPGEIASVIEGSSAKIIDYARVPSAPISAGYASKAILGAMVGAAVVVLITLLQLLMDVHINSEEDLVKISSIPVLGVIPALYAEPKKSKRKGKNGGRAKWLKKR